MRPVEDPGRDLDPPTENLVIRNLTKSAIKELRAKRRMEMLEKICPKRSAKVGASPDNLLVLTTIA